MLRLALWNRETVVILNVHSVFGLGADGERSGSKTTTSIRSGMLTLDYLEYPVEIM